MPVVLLLPLLGTAAAHLHISFSGASGGDVLQLCLSLLSVTAGHQQHYTKHACLHVVSGPSALKALPAGRQWPHTGHAFGHAFVLPPVLKALQDVGPWWTLLTSAGCQQCTQCCTDHACSHVIVWLSVLKALPAGRQWPHTSHAHGHAFVLLPVLKALQDTGP